MNHNEVRAKFTKFSQIPDKLQEQNSKYKFDFRFLDAKCNYDEIISSPDSDYIFHN